VIIKIVRALSKAGFSIANSIMSVNEYLISLTTENVHLPYQGDFQGMHAKASVIAKLETRQAVVKGAGSRCWGSAMVDGFRRKLVFCKARFLNHEFCHEVNPGIIVGRSPTPPLKVNESSCTNS
jgi:hypothetical protein